jgi:hypothetical protein
MDAVHSLAQANYLTKALISCAVAPNILRNNERIINYELCRGH